MGSGDRFDHPKGGPEPTSTMNTVRENEMRVMRSVTAAALVLMLSAAALGQVGAPLPSNIELEGFAKTPAKSFDDFLGRTVLLEFFAYW